MCTKYDILLMTEALFANCFMIFHLRGHSVAPFILMLKKQKKRGFTATWSPSMHQMSADATC